MPAAGEALRAAGARRVLPLPVSAPFHTSLMAPAAAGLSPELDAVSFGDLAAPLWTNVDAAPIRTGAEGAGGAPPAGGVAGAVGRDAPRMAAAGGAHFVELGEGRVLTGLVRKVVPEAAAASVSDPDGVERLLGVAA